MGGYIGLLLGYSFLQIPDFIILNVLKTKGWFEQFREKRDQNQTRTLKITIHENISASQDRSERESNDGWERDQRYVDINSHKELIARIEQLEKSAKSQQCTLVSLERNKEGSL